MINLVGIPNKNPSAFLKSVLNGVMIGTSEAFGGFIRKFNKFFLFIALKILLLHAFVEEFLVSMFQLLEIILLQLKKMNLIVKNISYIEY